MYDDMDVPFDNLLIHNNYSLENKNQVFRMGYSFHNQSKINDEDDVHYQGEVVYY